MDQNKNFKLLVKCTATNRKMELKLNQMLTILKAIELVGREFQHDGSIYTVYGFEEVSTSKQVLRGL